MCIKTREAVLVSQIGVVLSLKGAKKERKKLLAKSEPAKAQGEFCLGFSEVSAALLTRYAKRRNFEATIDPPTRTANDFAGQGEDKFTTNT